MTSRWNKQLSVLTSLKTPHLSEAQLEQYFMKAGLEAVVEYAGRNDEAISPNLRDLHRLHHFVRQTRRITLLEFGCGWSSMVLAHAIAENQAEFSGLLPNLKKHCLFELHVVDTSTKWLTKAQQRFEQETYASRAVFHHSPCSTHESLGRLVSRYDHLPPVNPDFIYLDGPDPTDVNGSVCGLSTATPDFMPMAADLVLIEHFLVPGTIIVVDGRGANARFLQSNLQRGWHYTYDDSFDQHIFVLVEAPLGDRSTRQIAFYAGIDIQ